MNGKFLVVMYIVFILFTITMTAVLFNKKPDGPNVHHGKNGVIETTCVDGYVVMMDRRGKISQLFGTTGGVQCSK